MLTTVLPEKYYKVNQYEIRSYHPAEEGGFWAEVPAIQGCATQGDTIEALLTNLYEAVEACLSVDLEQIEISKNDRVMEIAV